MGNKAMWTTSQNLIKSLKTIFCLEEFLARFESISGILSYWKITTNKTGYFESQSIAKKNTYICQSAISHRGILRKAKI